INTDAQHEQPLSLAVDPLPPEAGLAAAAHEPISADRDCYAGLDAGEVRLVGVRPTAPVKLRRNEVPAIKAASQPRIVIDNVAPSVDGGRFAAKCVVGERIVVEVDVFADGHDLLAVELLWRAGDENEWRRVDMRLLNNDRWQATFAPTRIGR